MENAGGLELTARTAKLRRLGKEEREEKEQGTWDEEEDEDLRRVLKEEGVDRVWEDEKDLGEMEGLWGFGDVDDESKAVEAAEQAIGVEDGNWMENGRMFLR